MSTSEFQQNGNLLPLGRQARYLWSEWRLMFSRATVVADCLAGVAVALVALPLSLAIANASGVPPAVGMITAVVGGVVVALFGGSRLQVSGPAAALTFLTLEIITHYGMSGLIYATLIAGLMQLAAGVFRLGRLMQFIPHPVIAGFLTGIGLTILASQASVMLGYEVDKSQEGGALALAWNTLGDIERTNFHTLAVGLIAFGLMLVVPRFTRRLPIPLLAVGGATLVCLAAGWNDVAMLGQFPSGLPMPGLPLVPQYEWNEVILAASTIFLLASIESLLSASVVDAMSKGPHVDHDQELFGQGLGNIASALFGGIPVTGVIARSATNVQSGARTRLSALVHALLILAVLSVLSPIAARIPNAALAGVLSAVALRMIETHIFQRLWRGSRPEAIVFVVTAGAIIATDLIDGVQIGLLATVLYFVYEMSKMNLRMMPVNAQANGGVEACPGVAVLRVEGPLFFGSGFHLRSAFRRIDTERVLIVDFDGTGFLDATGAEILAEGIELAEGRGVKVLLARLSGSLRVRLSRLGFPALARTPMYDEMRDALLHAATLLTDERLCRDCRPSGRCRTLDKTLASLAEMERADEPTLDALSASGRRDR
jgi:high affinity sulfate transporter 1